VRIAQFIRRCRFVRRRAVLCLLALLPVLIFILSVYAQRELPRKESRFTFARVQYATPMGGGGRRGFGGWGPIGASNGPPWSHDFPLSEENLMKIMSEVTRIDVNPGGHLINFGSEDCFKYPIAYLCEVGYLNLSDQEAKNMREYLLRGGFLIVDDFRGQQAINNFYYQMQYVFPDRQLEEIPRNHPIWTCFYDISNINLPAPYGGGGGRFGGGGGAPQYFGIKDDNGRLMMIVDYNTDISEYWEWSADPFYRISDTNEAFKYGVNFIMYALTH
jgi:hypothetical protein